MNSGGLNLINFLNVMAKHSQHGFKPFSEITNDSDVQGIVYDDSIPKAHSLNQTAYPVVSEYSLDGNTFLFFQVTIPLDKNLGDFEEALEMALQEIKSFEKKENEK